MATHPHIDRICAAILAVTLLLALAFVHGESWGLQAASRSMGYETRLFDTGTVHTIDIVMDDWDGFISSCENEEYVSCTVVIDGEPCRNVGIRAKGNTSLTTVSAMGSSRYSFKIEFDHYDSANTYYGLDKLSLNNTIQDTTYMKDFLTYRMMAAFGVNAPLCSFAYLTVNGADWGLYLAAEGVEDAFLQRCYGSGHGELYKPDSMSFGGGRGNGRQFDMDGFMDAAEDGEDVPSQSGMPDMAEPPDRSGPPDMPGLPDMSELPDMAQNGGEPPARPSGQGEPPGSPPDGFIQEGGPGGGPGGMGSSDVKLQYIDDDPDSYANIFDNAKTNVSEADQLRLIQSLQDLSQQENLENVLDIDQVIRYFVVHNFVCNGDSYTGSMVHNYYLYEDDGQLSMIPWDYNLAFGTFQGGDAASQVNAPIDSPVSSGASDDRPMVDWIFSGETYTELYHQRFAEFLEAVDISALIDETAAMIAPHVEKDPTKFYSYEEFTAGVAALKKFCLLRSESIAGQLAGTIPSTTAGQTENPAALVDASGLTLSDMGTMNAGGGGFQGGRPENQFPQNR